MSGATFGYRPGYAQLGSYRVSGGLAWIFALWGDFDSPAAGTVNAWIAAYGPFTNVVMASAYEPSIVNRYPTRTAVRAGDACQWPSVEADALVAAGLATYA
jgi:hypothetical protein